MSITFIYYLLVTWIQDKPQMALLKHCPVNIFPLYLTQLHPTLMTSSINFTKIPSIAVQLQTICNISFEQHQYRFAKPFYLPWKPHFRKQLQQYFVCWGTWISAEDNQRNQVSPSGPQNTKQTIKSRLEIWEWNKERLKDARNVTQENQRYALIADLCSVSMGTVEEEN